MIDDRLLSIIWKMASVQIPITKRSFHQSFENVRISMLPTIWEKTENYGNCIFTLRQCLKIFSICLALVATLTCAILFANKLAWYSGNGQFHRVFRKLAKSQTRKSVYGLRSHMVIHQRGPFNLCTSSWIRDIMSSSKTWNQSFPLYKNVHNLFIQIF